MTNNLTKAPVGVKSTLLTIFHTFEFEANMAWQCHDDKKDDKSGVKMPHTMCTKNHPIAKARWAQLQVSFVH